MKKILCIILALLFVLSMAACETTQEQPAAPAGETKYAEEVVIGLAKDIDTLNPMQSTSTIEGQMVYYCTHETIVYLNPETKEIVGDIAESWDISDDGLVYTFYLKKGIKFHNGDIMTADDVVYSFERALASAATARMTASIESVTKIDDTHVLMKLKYSYGPIEGCLTNVNCAIVSKSAAEADPEGLPQHVPQERQVRIRLLSPSV